jgi:5-formyltetrahydrofolate cyclo-ligase
LIVSLRTRKQDAKAAARAGAKSAKQQARHAGKTARQQARQATEQVAPLAKSARESARQGVHDARVWAAPRVERSGHLLEERVAPKVADMLTSTARRLEPPQPSRRRWPKVLAGIVMLGVGTAVAAALRSRLWSTFVTKSNGSTQAAAAAGPADSREVADSETADVNGQVRTP